MRVVLDTNVLISACLKPAGLEARVVEMAREGRIAVCLSGPVRLEYQDVFARAKFNAVREMSARLLADLDVIALPVAATKPVAAATDDDDNRLLECAEAAGADYLITGNLRHFPAQWAKTKIVNARGFLGAAGCIIEA